MKTSVWSLFALILIVGLTGCKKKEEEVSPIVEEETGAIFVTVVYNGQPVSDAVISVETDGDEGSTDESGNLLIEGFTEGVYHVFATHNEIGSGTGAVVVNPGEVSNVTVQLALGVFESPMVDMWVSPQNATVGETISIVAMVYDNSDPEEEIIFEWRTIPGGVISTEGANSNGVCSIEYAFDNEGEYLLIVDVTDSDGNTDSDSASFSISDLPVPVVLAPIEIQNYSLHLNWSQTGEEAFASYRIYREGQSGFQQIETIYDINTTSFIDEDVSLGVEYNYQIGLNLSDGNEILSNIQSGQVELEYIYIGTGLDLIKHHPTNPIIYGLDTDNNSLVIVNTETQDVNSIYVGSFPTGMDFSLDNQLLYIANSGAAEITIVDLTAQSVQSTISEVTGSTTWEENPYSLAVLSDGLLAFTGEESSANISVVSGDNGNLLSTNNYSLYYPYLAANSNGTKVFAGEGGSSNELHQYELIGDELILQESTNQSGSGANVIFVTADDEHVFYGKSKYLASDITNILGDFDDKVYAINSNGSRVLGEEQIFNGIDFSTITDLPFPTKVSVISNDGSSAWLYQEQSARLYKITVP